MLRKFSSAFKASPISVFLYQTKNNNNKVVRPLMDQTRRFLHEESNNNKVLRPLMDQTPRFLHEESKNPDAAEGTLLLDQISLRPFQLTDVDDMMVWATDERLIRYCGWKDIGLKGINSSSLEDEGLIRRYCGWKEIGLKAASKEEEEEDMMEKNKNISEDPHPHPHHHHLWSRAICLKKQAIGKIFVDFVSSGEHGFYVKGGNGLGLRVQGGYGMLGRVEAGYASRAMVSFVVASKHWGKGIATTAVKMSLDTIFKDLPHIKLIEATVYVENLAAQRVFEKAGFHNMGAHYYHLKGRIVDAAIFSFLST